MNNGQIAGLNTINGNIYPPQETSGNVPVGGIIMWSGAFLSLPTGYFLCDGGTYNDILTPDLRGRFIMGAAYASGTQQYSNQTGGSHTSDNQPIPQLVPWYDVNTTGGEINHKLTIGEIPSHTHQYFPPGNPNNCWASGACSGTQFTERQNNLFPTGATGGDLSHNNMPQYYILAFIMRCI